MGICVSLDFSPVVLFFCRPHSQLVFFLVVCFASAALLVSLKIALNFFLRMKPKPKPKNLNQMPKRYDSQSVTMQVVECEIGMLYILWKCKRNVEGVI